MKYVAIVGRLPYLSIAELEAVFGSQNIMPVSDSAILINSDEILEKASSLGGVIKIAKILSELPNKNWGQINDYLTRVVPQYLDFVPPGKLTVGLSTYDIAVTAARINASALGLKKIAKNYGRSVRIVPNKENALNSAQVLYNKLTAERGWELVFIGTKEGKTILAQTIYEQDIDDYASRDQQRPMRDARVGMLPPKLAQTIINLSGARAGQTLLDPFCGTGVLLQEALLAGIDCFGTDLEPKMIDYSSKNLEWLKLRRNINSNYSLETADATSHQWFSDTKLMAQDSVIACETYLGRALSSLPDQETLAKIISDCNTIHKKFLQNTAHQTQPGFRLCIAVPAWKTKNGFKHLSTLDHLEELGYNRMSFVHVDSKDLIYNRDNQIVARELVVLERI